MSYRVPTKDYRKQYEALWPELSAELERVFKNENPILGESVRLFEGEFACHAGAEFGVGVGSGTDALVLSMRALGIGAGDEVITAANTFAATVTAIATVGATPVLVDPDAETLCLEAESVARVLTERTRAIIPVHLYGRSCDMLAFLDLVEGTRISLIEDAAQAHGARIEDGRRVGSIGRTACFSFHPSKNLGAFGDGGIVLTSDADVAERVRILRDLGKKTKDNIVEVAPNSKLDTVQAALLRVKLRALDSANQRRQELAARYRDRLGALSGLDLPLETDVGRHVYHLFVVRTEGRDELRRELKASGINAGVHYPLPPHLQSVGTRWSYERGAFPIAEKAAGEVLSLPIAPELSDGQIDEVCAKIRELFLE